MKKSLFQELKSYGESDFYPFHMPGHKRSVDSGPLSDVYQYDITEIDGFDNLHEAEGIIKDAQEEAAALYHSKETYFLVNGSTSGVLTAISAVACRGKKLIIARNCHKAVYHAAILNHLELVYIYPDIIEEFGVFDGIRAEQVEGKLKEIVRKEKIATEQIGSVVAGILITSPTYDGILSDVRGIVKEAHRFKIPVIVDQAHGAHFGFHPAFPESAVAEGADLVIHSVHKTLPAPTQTALLHCNSSLIDSDIVRKYLRIYQSSSPSYLLMAGIDSCIELVEKEGKERLAKLLSYRKEFLKKTEKLKHIRIYHSMAENNRSGHVCSMDFQPGTEEPGRLLISVGGSNITGQQLYDMLREGSHLQMEMCASDYVIAILSMMDRKEGFERLSKALAIIDEKISNQKEIIFHSYQQCQPESVFKVREAFTAKSSYMRLEEAGERIAADFVNLYPPGIPILVPGEKIDNRTIQMIRIYLDRGYTVQGVTKEEISGFYCLKVIDQE